MARTLDTIVRDIIGNNALEMAKLTLALEQSMDEVAALKAKIDALTPKAPETP